MKRWILLSVFLAGCGQSAAVKEYMTGLGPCVNHAAPVEEERVKDFPLILAAVQKGTPPDQVPAMKDLQAKINAGYKAWGEQRTALTAHPVPADLKGLMIAYVSYLQEEEDYFKALNAQMTMMNDAGMIKENGAVCAKLAAKLEEKHKALEETDQKYR